MLAWPHGATWLSAVALALLILYIFRERVFLDLYAGFSIRRTRRPKKEDYVKLAGGEEGYIKRVGWRTTQISGLKDAPFFVTNWRLIHSLATSYHHRIKWAQDPFRFYTRFSLNELTGLKACNLHQLVQGLRQASDAVTYHHTYQFVKEHHYLRPQPTNEFAYWVKAVLGDEMLGEQLASINPCEFDSLTILRRRFVEVIEQYLPTVPELCQVPEGSEFQFVRSVNIVAPTPYVAHDLRELVEILPNVSTDSLYLHLVEAKLGLNSEVEDLCGWLENSLGNPDLAMDVNHVTPFSHTLEEIRGAVIELAEDRLTTH